MNQSLQIIKGMLDLCVAKGLLRDIESVEKVGQAFREIAGQIQELEQLKTKSPKI